MSVAVIPARKHSRRFPSKHLPIRKPGIYGYLGENVRGIVQKRKYSIEVDEPIDLKTAEAILGSEL